MSLPNFGEYMEFIKFVFSSFWTFIGFFLFALIAYAALKAAFDFIVELIHGKPDENKICLNRDAKIEMEDGKVLKVSKKEKEPQKIKGGVKMTSSEVSVRGN